MRDNEEYGRDVVRRAQECPKAAGYMLAGHSAAEETIGGWIRHWFGRCVGQMLGADWRPGTQPAALGEALEEGLRPVAGGRRVEAYKARGMKCWEDVAATLSGMVDAFGEYVAENGVVGNGDVAGIVVDVPLHNGGWVGRYVDVIDLWQPATGTIVIVESIFRMGDDTRHLYGFRPGALAAGLAMGGHKAQRVEVVGVTRTLRPEVVVADRSLLASEVGVAMAAISHAALMTAGGLRTLRCVGPFGEVCEFSAMCGHGPMQQAK